MARVITPGTLVDEKFIDPAQNNFILAVYIDISSLKTQKEDQGEEESAHQHFLISGSHPVGLSWLDLSTGEFFTQFTTVQALLLAVARIEPREILMDQSVRDLIGQELRSQIGEDSCLFTSSQFPREIAPMSEWGLMLESPAPAAYIDEFTPEETAAGYNLLEYIGTRLQISDLKLQLPRRRQLNESMKIDWNTLKGLEIIKTACGGCQKGSLLHAVKRTCMKSGVRLLRDCLSAHFPEVHLRLSC